MGKKFALTVLGIGAGVYFAKREIDRHPNGALAQMFTSLKENEKVQSTVQAGKDKVSEAVRKQGEVVTDKVADMVKERLFGAEPKPEEVEIEVEPADEPR